MWWSPFVRANWSIKCVSGWPSIDQLREIGSGFKSCELVSRARFSLPTLLMLGQRVFCYGSCIPGLCPLRAGRILPLMTARNGSGYSPLPVNSGEPWLQRLDFSCHWTFRKKFGGTLKDYRCYGLLMFRVIFLIITIIKSTCGRFGK